MKKLFLTSELIVAVIAVCTLCYSCGNSGDSANANDGVATKTSLSPFERLQQAAEKGDAHAQYQLSEHYLKEKDFDNVFKWSKKAAEQGLDSAQWRLAQYYMSKTDDVENGVYWTKQAANQGHGEALCSLALLLLYDDGDLKGAMELIDKARKTDPASADKTTETIAAAIATALN